MGFTALGNLGTASSKASSTTLGMSPTSDVAVGTLLVVWYASDSTGDGTPPGVCNRRWKCSDSVGNVWVTIFCDTDNNDNGFAAAAIFVCQVTTAITTSDTITVTSNPAKTAKAMSLEGFTLASGMKWSTENVAARTVDRGVDPSAITVSGRSSGVEYLYLHVLGAEGPDTDAYTWDTDYTQVTGAGTTGGTADSNIHVRGGYRIASITGDTVDVTSDTANRDYTQGLQTLREVTYKGNFPTVPVLDDFNRADESPLSDGGNWDTTLRPNQSFLRLVSNDVNATNGSNGGSFWNQTFSDDTDSLEEVFASVSALGGAGQSLVDVLLNATGSANAGTLSARGIGWSRSGVANAVDDCLSYAYPGPGGGPVGSSVQTRLRIWQDCAAGHKCGIQKRERAYHVWLDRGSGWEWVACHYDAGLVTANRRFALACYSTANADDFGAGLTEEGQHLLPLLGVGA